MERLGHQVKHRPHAGTQFEWNEIDALLKGADVVITGRMAHAQVFAALLAGRDKYGYKLVVDTDDLSDDVPKFNYAHADYHSATNVARLVRAELREADLVTVSTGPLAKWAAKYSKKPPVVVPNVVDPRLHANVVGREKEPRHRDDVRIYWGGGGGHYGDLLTVKEPILQIMAERPNVKLVFSGFIPDWAADLPPFRVFMIRFAEFTRYPQVLKWLCADIALAPLVENEFNRCKSHVKWLDYSMALIPGVYQDLDPYEGVVGKKASSISDWYEDVSDLLENSWGATIMAGAAKREVMDNWTIDSHAKRYEQMLMELVNEKTIRPLQMLVEGQPVEAPCLTLQS
jgi:hypothetical protein